MIWTYYNKITSLIALSETRIRQIRVSFFGSSAGTSRPYQKTSCGNNGYNRRDGLSKRPRYIPCRILVYRESRRWIFETYLFPREKKNCFCTTISFPRQSSKRSNFHFRLNHFPFLIRWYLIEKTKVFGWSLLRSDWAQKIFIFKCDVVNWSLRLQTENGYRKVGMRTRKMPISYSRLTKQLCLPSYFVILST